MISHTINTSGLEKVAPALTTPESPNSRTERIISAPKAAFLHLAMAYFQPIAEHSCWGPHSAHSCAMSHLRSRHWRHAPSNLCPQPRAPCDSGRLIPNHGGPRSLSGASHSHSCPGGAHADPTQRALLHYSSRASHVAPARRPAPPATAPWSRGPRRTQRCRRT